ncbi:MAG: hypothetical protein KC964_19990, partial [Candidatus Omnitrophica bacterium]|nr:hypothetical protein [Candidatus Omnitrophota bacterium]
LDGLQWPPDGSLLCTVYATTEHGGILPGAKIQLAGKDGPIEPLIIKEDGTVFLVESGVYSIQATYPGFTSETIQVSLDADDGNKDPEGKVVFIELRKG